MLETSDAPTAELPRGIASVMTDIQALFTLKLRKIKPLLHTFHFQKGIITTFLMI